MSTDYSMGIGPFEKDETLFQCFNDLIACLYQTIVASKDPNLLFLSHLSDVTLSLTERLDGISRGWLIAGAPDFPDPAMDDVLQHAIEMAGVVSRVLKKEMSMQEVQEESEWGEHWSGCDLAAELSCLRSECQRGNKCQRGNTLKACSKVSRAPAFFVLPLFPVTLVLTPPLISQCKSVQYCCHAHPKLAWPKHRNECFTPQW